MPCCTGSVAYAPVAQVQGVFEDRRSPVQVRSECPAYVKQSSPRCAVDVQFGLVSDGIAIAGCVVAEVPS